MFINFTFLRFRKNNFQKSLPQNKLMCKWITLIHMLDSFQKVVKEFSTHLENVFCYVFPHSFFSYACVENTYINNTTRNSAKYNMTYKFAS